MIRDRYGALVADGPAGAAATEGPVLGSAQSAAFVEKRNSARQPQGPTPPADSGSAWLGWSRVCSGWRTEVGPSH